MVYLSYPHVITGETIYLVVLSVLLWNLEAFTGLDFGLLLWSAAELEPPLPNDFPVELI